MARLPSIKRLAVEDFQSQKAWISALLYPINLFFTAVIQALTNGLTFSDNLSAVVKTIAIAKNQIYPVTFTWTLKAKPIGLWLVYVYEPTPPHTNLAAAVSVDWEYTTTGKVQINALPGLPNAAYNITVVAITG